METSKKHGVCEKVPIEEHWKETGKMPVGAKSVEANKGDMENPEYRCRSVAKEIKKDTREDSPAATPPPEAKTRLFSLWARVCQGSAYILKVWFGLNFRRELDGEFAWSCLEEITKDGCVGF